MKLELQPPLKNFKVNQPFGVDWSHKACTYVASYPCNLTLYQYFGMKGHTGLDCQAQRGDPVYASHDGKVTEIETEEERGLGVGITMQEKREMEGGEYFAHTRYWHLQYDTVSMGQVVKAGDLIGYADNTGYSSGDHLHYELKPKNEKGKNVFQDNGFYGAVDPKPYLKMPEPLRYVALGERWYTEPILGVTKTTVNLNVRSTPNVGWNNKVETLPAGSQIEILKYAGRNGGYEWVQIK